MRRPSLAMLRRCQADRRRPHNVGPSSFGGLLDDGREGAGQLAGLREVGETGQRSLDQIKGGAERASRSLELLDVATRGIQLAGVAVAARALVQAGDAAEALLRLEMAAEAPTPAEHIDARRFLQLQLLTRRNDPAPAQTWGQDAARVLASANHPASARRLQNVLKTLLRK